MVHSVEVAFIVSAVEDLKLSTTLPDAEHFSWLVALMTEQRTCLLP
jgi:hypothetical protein